MADGPTSDRDLGVITESEKRLKVPPLYKVLLHNDDYTTMEFVVQVLQTQVAFTYVERAEEFDGQTEPQRFGAVSISRKF